MAMLVLFFLGRSLSDYSSHFSFGFSYIQENLTAFAALAGVFGVLRLVGAIGLLKNRLWGLVLSVVMILVTLNTMLFVLPAGIADGVLSGGALVLIVLAYFAKQKISA